MSVKAGYCTPLLHVEEIERSIRFYELVGFATIDTDRAKPLGWARLHCEGGALMLVRAEEGLDKSAAHAVLLYVYTPDLVGLREQLLANQVEVSPTRYPGYPGYMPSGELSVDDPDGYSVLVAHWGSAEQEAWEKRIAIKA